MTLNRIPALFMRGGTSKALVFLARDLPAEQVARDRIFLAAMGTPDPNGRQLDGMGGGISSLSKVCILGPASREDADIDYTFAQIGVGRAEVDYAGNCGNMSSAMGPAALELGLVPPPDGAEAAVRIHNTNTGKIIVARFPVRDGLLDPEGDFAIDGVAGQAAPIRLEFLEPGGAKTGRLLPTGHAVDDLTLPDGTTIRASLVDAANPCVFVAAADMDKTGAEGPDDLVGDAAFMDRMEAIRRAGSVLMGLTPDMDAAAAMPSLPKVAMVAPAADSVTLSGAVIPAGEMSLLVRMISMEQPHRAVPITGAICLAAATRVTGSVPQMAVTEQSGAVVVGHPSGTTVVDAEITQVHGAAFAQSATIYRTARTLFAGEVRFRLS